MWLPFFISARGRAEYKPVFLNCRSAFLGAILLVRNRARKGAPTTALFNSAQEQQLLDILIRGNGEEFRNPNSSNETTIW